MLVLCVNSPRCHPPSPSVCSLITLLIAVYGVQRCIRAILLYFNLKNTTFDYHFINFSLNVIKFGMLIDNVEIDKSHDFGCYETILVRNYEFLTKMCVFIN